jgi:hypothetical protein
MQPRAANVAPRCVIRNLTFVPVTKGVAVATKQPNRLRLRASVTICFSYSRSVPEQLLRGDGGVRDGVGSPCFNRNGNFKRRVFDELHLEHQTAALIDDWSYAHRRARNAISVCGLSLPNRILGQTGKALRSAIDRKL